MNYGLFVNLQLNRRFQSTAGVASTVLLKSGQAFPLLLNSANQQTSIVDISNSDLRRAAR